MGINGIKTSRIKGFYAETWKREKPMNYDAEVSHYLHRESFELPYLVPIDSDKKRRFGSNLIPKGTSSKDIIKREAQKFREMINKWENRQVAEKGGKIETTRQISNGEKKPSERTQV